MGHAQPSPGPTAPRRSLGQLLAQVERRVATRVERVLCPAGLSLDQWRVLALLSDGRGHSMTEIAGHAMVPAPTLTKIVDRLVESALVHRRVDDSDRRRVLVLTSEHGAGLHRRLAPVVARAEDDIAAELDEAEADQLKRLLSRLADTSVEAVTRP